jgi:hypothetical protein
MAATTKPKQNRVGQKNPLPGDELPGRDNWLKPLRQWLPIQRRFTIACIFLIALGTLILVLITATPFPSAE